jgi:hypothetical protein
VPPKPARPNTRSATRPTARVFIDKAPFPNPFLPPTADPALANGVERGRAPKRGSHTITSTEGGLGPSRRPAGAPHPPYGNIAVQRRGVNPFLTQEHTPKSAWGTGATSYGLKRSCRRRLDDASWRPYENLIAGGRSQPKRSIRHRRTN